jgi:molecular chaperone GrpE
VQVVAEAEEREEVEKEEKDALAAEEDVEGEAEEARVKVDQIKEKLEEAEAQAAEYLDGWQRTRAEFSNYKKRREAERAHVIARANAELLRKLLPIVDDLERALANLPDNLRQLTWCEGISLIKHKLDAVLESEGVKPIETDGRAFDPRVHEAVTYEEIKGYEDGQIIAEVQPGYMLDEWILRPALVRVAKAPAAAQPEESEEDEGGSATEPEDESKE